MGQGHYLLSERRSPPLPSPDPNNVSYLGGTKCRSAMHAFCPLPASLRANVGGVGEGVQIIPLYHVL